MSNDEKVLDFPRVEVTSEENVRRVMVEATRLASLAPGEWRLWIDRSAERLGVSRRTLQDLIAAIIKDSKKKAQQAETADPTPRNSRFGASGSASNANKNANRSESTRGPNTDARKKRKHSNA